MLFVFVSSLKYEIRTNNTHVFSTYVTENTNFRLMMFRDVSMFVLCLVGSPKIHPLGKIQRFYVEAGGIYSNHCA